MIKYDEEKGIVEVGDETSLDEIAHFLHNLYEAGRDCKIFIVDEFNEETDPTGKLYLPS